MSSTEEEDLFGPETDDDDTLPPPAKKTKRVAKKKKKKNAFMTKLMKQAKSMADTNRAIEAAVRAHRQTEEEPLPPRPEVSRKRPRLSNEVCGNLQDPILVREDDLEKRESAPPTLAKIQRDIWVKRTRYYPYNVECNHDLNKFYTTPTDLCCMWCTLPVNAVPIAMPMKYSKCMDAFYVTGQVCSIACLMANASKKGLKPLTSFFLSRVYGIRYDSPMLKCAPNPHVLTKFGGPMSEEAYRSSLYLKELKFTDIVLPFVPFAAGIEEVERVRTVIYEYGDEDKVKRVVNSNIVVSRPTPIENISSKKMQVSKFSKMPTLEEQIALSERKLRLQMQETGMDENGKSKKKSRTLRDFMNIKSNK